MYGDLFQRLLYATRPYEEVPGAAEGIMKKYEAAIFENCRDGNFSTYKQLVQEIVRDYDTMPLRRIKKPRVGVVGEILVKYHPDANNNIVDIIEKEGGEAVVLDLIDFFLYGMYSKKFNYENLSGTYQQYKLNQAAIALVEQFRRPLRKALRQSRRFEEPSYIQKTAEEASEIASIGNQCGEGWAPDRRNDRADQGWRDQHRLPAAVCLPAESCDRQGYDESHSGTLSEGKYRSYRL